MEKNNTELLNDYNNEQEKMGNENNENDNVFVRRIIRHKKVGGEYQFLLEFSDLTKEFATESMAKIDCNDLLKEYKRKKLNNPKETNNRKQIKTAKKEIGYRCKNDHSSIEAFESESNKKYFSRGQMLWKVKCHDCNIVISSGDDDDGEEQLFCPSLKCPVYTCNNRTQGCRVTMCGKCAKKAILDAGNSRKKRRINR